MIPTRGGVAIWIVKINHVKYSYIKNKENNLN